jgi:hypothetical protein
MRECRGWRGPGTCSGSTDPIPADVLTPRPLWLPGWAQHAKVGPKSKAGQRPSRRHLVRPGRLTCHLRDERRALEADFAARFSCGESTSAGSVTTLMGLAVTQSPIDSAECTGLWWSLNGASCAPKRRLCRLESHQNSQSQQKKPTESRLTPVVTVKAATAVGATTACQSF